MSIVQLEIIPTYSSSFVGSATSAFGDPASFDVLSNDPFVTEMSFVGSTSTDIFSVGHTIDASLFPNLSGFVPTKAVSASIEYRYGRTGSTLFGGQRDAVLRVSYASGGGSEIVVETDYTGLAEDTWGNQVTASDVSINSGGFELATVSVSLVVTDVTNLSDPGDSFYTNARVTGFTIEGYYTATEFWTGNVNAQELPL